MSNWQICDACGTLTGDFHCDCTRLGNSTQRLRHLTSKERETFHHTLLKAVQAETWNKREAKYPWRNFLTAHERLVLERADAAKRVWLDLNKERASITNRAIQRAKYAAENGSGAAPYRDTSGA